MADNDKSIWLGPKFRSFFRKFTLASGGIFAALVAWVIIGDMTIGLGVELRTILHPTTNLSVMLMLISGTVTLFSTSIYLSDFKGDIEIQPEGFFRCF